MGIWIYGEFEKGKKVAEYTEPRRFIIRIFQVPRGYRGPDAGIAIKSEAEILEFVGENREMGKKLWKVVYKGLTGGVDFYRVMQKYKSILLELRDDFRKEIEWLK